MILKYKEPITQTKKRIKQVWDGTCSYKNLLCLFCIQVSAKFNPYIYWDIFSGSGMFCQSKPWLLNSPPSLGLSEYLRTLSFELALADDSRITDIQLGWLLPMI